MRIEDLCRGIVTVESEEGCRCQEISSVAADSRRVREGSLFVCLKGEKQDGGSFIADAIRRGAAAVLSEAISSIECPEGSGKVVFLRHSSPKEALPKLLARFYGDPGQRLSLLGITGTNGKTTATYLVEAIYRCSGRRCGVIGTVNYRFAGRVFEAKNTTPGVADNFDYLAQMIEAGTEACVMEVSSHALVQDRVQGMTFKQAVFSNLTSDHLDYHRTREDYFLAKSRFFDGTVAIKTAVLNQDDPYGQRLKQMTTAPVVTYGIDHSADVQAVEVSLGLAGSRFRVNTPSGPMMITTPLIGKHNVYNILAAVSVCLNEKFSLDQIQQGIQSLDGVPGRLERIDGAQGFFVFVDYAHTEDALSNVLQSLRGTGPARILVVFGCGGDRDKTKRPKMAAVVEKWADVAIVTNDNPRTEDPERIVADIKKGFQGNAYEVILDRGQAINRVMSLARPGDCVLIAGKGHEDYQIFKDRTIHFDDREIVRSFLKG